MCDVLAIALAAMQPGTPRHRFVLIAMAAAFAPFTGLQTAAYVVVASITWIVLMRRRFAEVTAILIGIGLGLIALLALYVSTGTAGVFIEYALEHAKDAADPVKDIYFSDRSLMPTLAAAVLLWFATRNHNVVERWRVVRFLIVLSIVTPLSLAIIGKYPHTYTWMAYAPAVLSVVLLMREISWSNLGRVGQIAVVAAAACLVIAASIFPARMLVTGLEWQGRSYKAVEDFVASHLNSDDIAFGDFAVYYPVRQKARSASFGDYIRLMSSQEKAALTVLIVDRMTAEKRVVQVGGEWIKAASFKPVLDSVPRRFGFGEPSYDFVIMRRFARADNGASTISAESR
jgi:hypothetical protein